MKFPYCVIQGCHIDFSTYNSVFKIHFFLYFRYVPATLDTSRGLSNGEKSAAVSGGGFSFHDMFEHAHNLHPNGNESATRHAH